MIDDGLLINGNRIIAGKSAKKEKLYMGAIKTASSTIRTIGLRFVKP